MANTAEWNPDVRDEGGSWFSVQSETAPGCRYQVNLPKKQCSCPGSQFRSKQLCKHIEAVRRFISFNPLQISPADEQQDFLNKMMDASARMAPLASKARSIGLSILGTDLEIIAKQLAGAVDLQRRALSAHPKIRQSAFAESELPFRIL
jgi:hypothetical protein